MTECYLCKYPHPKLTKQDALWILEMMKPCPEHKTEIDKKLQELEEAVLDNPKKYTLKKSVTDFLPKKQEVARDYNEPREPREREANDGSLIE